MRPRQPPGGKCPQNKPEQVCNLSCKYNFFEAGELVINSWELKCLDCGYRVTIAYRSDEPEGMVDNPQACPFCQLCGLVPGRNPCDRANA